MQQTGRLATWNDERGFGFIDCEDGDRVFVHIKSIARIATRPRIGDRLRFDLGPGRDGRPSAINVRVEGANPVDPRAARRGLPRSAQRLTGRRLVRLLLAAVLAAALVAAAKTGQLPAWFGWIYLGMGLVSGFAYLVDKRRAEADAWRVPESSLHTLDLVFGVAGGLVAQAAFNHKVSKPPFAAMTLLITALHVMAIMALATGVVAFPAL